MMGEQATRHAPGPWVVNPDSRKECKQNYRIESEAGNTICVCSTGWGVDDRAEANACLIAAAPDLLANLIALLTLTERYEEDIEWDRGVGRSLEELAAIGKLPPQIVHARAAIAKAEPPTTTES